MVGSARRIIYVIVIWSIDHVDPARCLAKSLSALLVSICANAFSLTLFLVFFFHNLNEISRINYSGTANFLQWQNMFFVASHEIVSLDG